MKEPRAEDTLAANLTALHQHYRETRARPASDKALAEKAGIARRTVEAARKGTRPLEIDNIQKIAQAYDLPLHQLLMPGLDPGKPIVMLTEAQMEAEVERRVRERLKAVGDLIGGLNAERAGPDGRSAAKPFGDLQAPKGEPNHDQGDADPKAAGKAKTSKRKA